MLWNCENNKTEEIALVAYILPNPEGRNMI